MVRRSSCRWVRNHQMSCCWGVIVSFVFVLFFDLFLWGGGGGGGSSAGAMTHSDRNTRVLLSSTSAAAISQHVSTDPTPWMHPMGGRSKALGPAAG